MDIQIVWDGLMCHSLKKMYGSSILSLHHTWSLLLEGASVSNRSSPRLHNNIVVCRIDPADVTDSRLGQMPCMGKSSLIWSVLVNLGSPALNTANCPGFMGLDWSRPFVPKNNKHLLEKGWWFKKNTWCLFAAQSLFLLRSILRKVRTNFQNCPGLMNRLHLGPLIGCIFRVFIKLFFLLVQIFTI